MRYSNFGHFVSITALLAFCCTFQGQACGQDSIVKKDVRYANGREERHVLDIYAPAGAKAAPVVFWIHGGGWQAGDKSDVQIKPKAFNEKGYVFVSSNYRLLPKASMEELTSDLATSLKWVHDHISEYGGDPNRIIVGGHSAGAQLAALLCTNELWTRNAGLNMSILKACIPVDGDTYDIPAIIETEEIRRRAHGMSLPTLGHRQKFGNDPLKHINFSAVTHIAKGKSIPPFYIMYVAGHPYTDIQAQRLGKELKKAGIETVLYGAAESTHNKVNAEIGNPEDPGTRGLFPFLEKALSQGPK